MSYDKILVIDDDEDDQEIFLAALGSASSLAQCTALGSAIEALKKLSSGALTIDIIFLDLRMPNMDGIGFLKAYEPKTQHKDVQIIVFSNYDLQQEIDEAYDLGAQRYVLKAWASPKELIKIVEDTIADKK